MGDYINLVVEISITVYVFLLGLPLLVYQIFLPDELRGMSRKNYTGNLMRQVIILTVLLFVIILTAYPLQPQIIPLFSHKELLPAKVPFVTILFIAMVFYTLGIIKNHLLMSQGYRANIVEVIKAKIKAEYGKSGKVDQGFLEDMEYLGTYSKAGTETRIVIEALEDLLRVIRPKREAGSESGILISIIDTLCLSVANSTDSGNRQNMEEVLTIYKSVLMELKSHSTDENPLINSNETRKIKDCTTKIAMTALKKDYTDMMPLVLNVLTLIPHPSDKLFDIGLIALKKEQFQIATNVLSEIIDRDNQDYLTMNNYLGLIAHFYYGGQAARKFALRSLESHGVFLKDTLIADAKEYHYIMSNFTTADKLEEFSTDIGTG